MKQKNFLKIAAVIAAGATASPTESVEESVPCMGSGSAAVSAAAMPPYKRLSVRDFEMFRLLGMGRSLAQIAFYFTITPRVAARRLAALQSTLGCRSRTGLGRMAAAWVKGRPWI